MPEAHQICPELYHFIAIRHQGNLVPGTKRQATSDKQQAEGLRQIVARQFGELT
jgi:hypothetical protein